MIYINIIIFVLSVLLAILSRKHFSKYKDKAGAKGCIESFIISVGYGIWGIISKIPPLQIVRDKIQEQLGKKQIASPKRLEVLTEKFIARCLGISVLIIFVFNVLELGYYIANFSSDRGNVIKREDYAGDASQEEIYYQVSGKEQSVVISVSPVRLTQEEFYQEATVVAESIREELLPEGKLISGDIELPLVSSSDAFVISWESDKPDIISSKGRVNMDAVDNTVEVKLTMTIFYYDYMATYSYMVLVGQGEVSQEQLIADKLTQALSNLEQDTLEEQEFVIPDQIEEIKIELRNEGGKAGRFLLIGIILSIMAFGISISRLKEAGKARNEQLMREYPSFVDRLWLYIEAGMNVRKALQECVDSWDMEENYLREQLRYTLNQIDNGQAEHSAYEELGARLGLPAYTNLMRHISQNVRMGTKDLRILMETEATLALVEKKERAKRLGEEASTKLVFPMIVLLVVVMVIIMTPAFMGF